MRRAWLLALLCALVLAGSSRPGPVAFRATDVPSVFAIRKSENRNRVEYAIHLDARCAPEGHAPVVPYWRMLERGASVLEGLRRIEVRAYGIASQDVRLDESGGRVELRLRGLPERPIFVTTASSESGCTATAVTRIAGRRARLRDIFVVLRGPFSVDHVELEGIAEDGSRVHEDLAR